MAAEANVLTCCRERCQVTIYVRMVREGCRHHHSRPDSTLACNRSTPGSGEKNRERQIDLTGIKRILIDYGARPLPEQGKMSGREGERGAAFSFHIICSTFRFPFSSSANSYRCPRCYRIDTSRRTEAFPRLSQSHVITSRKCHPP